MQWFNKILLLLVVMWSVSSAHACQSINFGFTSRHYKNFYYENDQAIRYNEHNYGFGCDSVYRDFDIQVYKNSHHRNSVAIGKFKSYDHASRYDIGFQYGLITGYSAPVLPYALPRVDIHLFDPVTLSVISLWDQGIAFSLRINLK